MTTKLHCMSATEIAALIRGRQLTAVESLHYFQRRVERYDTVVNAVVVRDWKRAYDAAQLADHQVAIGATLGPLHGVPMTVKESLDIAGLPTNWGDPALRDWIAPRDDLIVERL